MAPSRTGLGAVMAMAAIAITVSTALQPILLGGLVGERRLDLAELGQAATAELIAMAVSCSLAGMALPPRRLRPIAAVACGGLVAANLLTMAATHGGILLARGLSGACYGVLMWITINLLVRSPHAVRHAGLITALQAVVAVALSTGFSRLMVAGGGIDRCYGALALLSAAMAAAARLLPPGFGALPAAAGGRIPPPRGLVGLLAIFLYLAGLIGMWVYLGAMSRQSGHPPAETALVLSIAFGAQFVGAVLTSLLGERLPPLVALGIGGVGGLALAVAFTRGLPIVPFAAAAGLFGLLWTFCAPFVIPFILRVDPGRIAGLYALTAQMLGAAAGPAIGAAVVRGSDVRPALIAGGGLMAAAVVVALAVTVIRPSAGPATGRLPG